MVQQNVVDNKDTYESTQRRQVLGITDQRTEAQLDGYSLFRSFIAFILLSKTLCYGYHHTFQWHGKFADIPAVH